MPAFSAVPFSLTNKITICLLYIRPIDVKQSGSSLLRHNPLPHPNFAVITFKMILTTATSLYYCGSKLHVHYLDDNMMNLSHYLK